MRGKQMKIKTTTTVTEIECNAEELRQSNGLADAFWGAFRKAFNGPISDANDCLDEEEDNDVDE